MCTVIWSQVFDIHELEVVDMVLILDGNSEIPAHLCNYLDYLMCLEPRADSNLIFIFLKRPICLYSCVKCSELSSNISNMVKKLGMGGSPFKFGSHCLERVSM